MSFDAPASPGTSRNRARRATSLGLVALVAMIVVSGCLPTTYGGGNARTGWFGNQTTLSPGLVSSGTFGEMWNANVTGQVYAQPLQHEGTIVAVTETNDIYGLDAVNGTQRWHRQVGVPFNPNDVTCGDLTPAIGITGTPVIDPDTDTAYFVKKTYVTGSSGAAAWWAHAVDTATGAERAGFPLRLQGTAANDPTMTFNATTHLQRPGLLLLDGVVYAGFGGHCDRANYQGWVIGFTTAGQLSTLWSSEAGETGNPGAGIWQSGGGLVSDAPGEIVLTTGNGNIPAGATPGSSGAKPLGQAVVRLKVQPDKTLKTVDFFIPYDAGYLNSWDADLGSGAPVALPSSNFGTAAYPRLGLQMGKQGYLYVLDQTNLGGYRQGPSGSDNVIQRLGPFGGAWSKPGVWPGDGGYVYITTASGGASASGSSGLLQAFKYGIDGSGKPTFSLVGTSAGAFGFSSGSPVISSNGTQSGTALVWVIWSPDGSGNNAQLRAYDPIPVNGTMNLRWSTPIGQSSKFSVPLIADNRVIIGTRDGKIRSFGSPITAPMSGPSVTFPDTTVGQSTVRTVTLTANFDLTASTIVSNDPHFVVGTASPPLPATRATGQTLTIPVTYTPTAVELSSASLTVNTTAGPVIVGLSGSGRASGAVITANPPALSLGGAVVNGTPITGSVTFRNAGATALTITTVDPPAAPFSATGLPAAGSTLAPGASVSATVTFTPTATGVFTDAIELSTTGGDIDVPVSGTASLAPHLTLSATTIPYGNVTVGGSKSISFTATNDGGAPLTLTKSKPPTGGIFTATTTIVEGTTIPAGSSVTGVVRFTPTAPGPVSGTWDITGNDGTGPQVVTFTGTGTAPLPPVPPASGGWQLNGAATLSGSNLVLTPNADNLAGSAFWPSQVATSGFRVTFDETIDQGDGADGLTFTFADPAAGAVPTSLGGTGGSLGWSGIPGVAVTFDTYQNGADPSSNFVGIATSASGDNLTYAATTTAIGPLRNNTRRVIVTYTGGMLQVSVAGVVVLNQAVVLPPNAYIGWTAGTGGLSDRHMITNVVFG